MAANSLDIIPNEDIITTLYYVSIPMKEAGILLDEIPAHCMNLTIITFPIQTSIPTEDLFYETEYKVRAHTSQPSVFYESDIATGYPTDNIAPIVSFDFGANHQDDQLVISWSYDPEDDFSHHTFYSNNQFEINTLDTLITIDMVSDYDEHYVA